MIIIYPILLIVEITSHPHNRQISIYSTITLTCTSSISSHVTFSWTHNNTNIKRAHSSVTTGATTTLTITNVRYSDGGSYMCIVKRGSLSVTSNTATITVYGKLNLSITISTVWCIILLLVLPNSLFYTR